MRLKRMLVGLAFAATATAGIATAAAAPAHAVSQAPKASASAVTTTSGDVGIAAENYYNCGYSYQDCVYTRSNFARYYRVSPLYKHHDGCTLPGGCPANTYFFYYYT